MDKSTIDRGRSEAYQKYLRDMMNRMQQDAEKKNSTSASAPGREFFDKPQNESEVSGVELFVKENARRHHTDKYSLVHNVDGSLIIRRGQPFKMAVNFKGDFNPDDDERLKLEFTFGHEPNRSKGSQVLLEVTNQTNFTRRNAMLPMAWDVKREGVSGNQVNLEVQVPPTVGIGVWTLSINLTPKRDGAPTKKFKQEKNIYILFNPWCKDDTVYMEKEKDKEEYVLNDIGKLYFGSYSEYTSRRWVYGQFNVASLPAAMFMLDLSGLLYNARSNPVRVSRAISNMMNKASDIPGDVGVLVGLWGKSNKEYQEGTAPWFWTGSGSILQQFLTKNGRPVKYGQCWVFAGVATTVCRALGIPSRSVTCFVAGHDSDETLTIDVTYNKDGERTSNSSDSIWNFHVWTEVYMSRPDLPEGYGGWQVIDGTPQEISGDGYQLGPCSVFGVKNGQVGLLYDTLFVFSEVNADMISWMERTDNEGFDKAVVSTDHIGRLMITKRVGEYDDQGDDDAEDITSLYKFKEGTAEERTAVLNAARNAGKLQLFDIPDSSKDDLIFELLPVLNVMTGDDFQMSLSIENNGENRRTVLITLRCYSVCYNGVIAKFIMEGKKTIVVPSGQKVENETTWTVKASKYVDCLVEFGMIKVYGMATVPETNQSWAAEQDFVVQNPKLKLELPDRLQVKQDYTLRVTFKNPYQKTLTKCQFAAEGTGLIEFSQSEAKDLKGHEKLVKEFPITPHYKCHTAVVVVFHSRELTGITGSKQITVVK